MEKVIFWFLVAVTATASSIGLPLMFGHVELGSLLNLVIVWWATFGIMWLFARKWRTIIKFVVNTWQHQRRAHRVDPWYFSLKFLLMLSVFLLIVPVILYGDWYLQVALHSSDLVSMTGGALTVVVFAFVKVIGYHRGGYDYEADIEQSICLTV